jgi:hypothetical protein
MHEEGVKEHWDAKRKSAKRFDPEKTLSLGSHLPTNAEVHGELSRLITLREQDLLPERILRLRMIVLAYLERFEDFSPYLVGSVLPTAVTSTSTCSPIWSKR